MHLISFQRVCICFRFIQKTICEEEALLHQTRLYRNHYNHDDNNNNSVSTYDENIIVFCLFYFIVCNV